MTLAITNLLLLSKFGNNGLNLIPCFHRDHGFAIIGDDEIRIMQLAFVDGVCKKRQIGIERAVEPDAGVDEFERLILRAHLKGFLNTSFEGGIWNPSVRDMLCFVTAFADVDELTHDPARRSARHAAIFLNEVTQAALCVDARLTALLFVGHVDEEFDEATIVSVRDVVFQRMDDDAPPADVYFVTLRVIDVAGEAGVIPEDETVGALVGAEIHVDHALEIVAVLSGAARFGFVYKVVTQDERMEIAEGDDLGQLLICGLVLFHAAAVSPIGIDDRARGERGGGREVGQGEGERMKAECGKRNAESGMQNVE